MKKLFILILVIFSITNAKIYSQNLTFENLVSYVSKENNLIAEELLDKGYQFYGSEKSGSFQKGDEEDSMSINIERDHVSYVQLCCSKKYENINTYITDNIKTKAKKTNTFYSPWFKIYVTEYVYKKNTFVYVGQGMCFTKDMKPKKFIIVAEENLRNFLFDKKD